MHHRQLETGSSLALALAMAALTCARIDAGTPSGGTGTQPGKDAGGPVTTGGGDAAAADQAAPIMDQAAPIDLRTTPDLSAVPDGGMTTTPGADAACAMQSAMAETLPLDLFVMMDSSGSMTEKTATGTTKWDAVKAAMTAFFGDPSSGGLGVGLQFFPLFQPNVPVSCKTDANCAGFGPCDQFNTCYGPATLQVTLCRTNADCPPTDACVPLGTCGTSNISCAPIGLALCPTGDICSAGSGSCHARDKCDVASYAMPAVRVAALPGAAAALMSSLAAQQPGGATPTGPALSGAIQAAQAHATANPGHRVAVVLVTDGLPTECTPVDVPAIAAIAATGAAGPPAVPTFVIGVFAPADAATATANLNTLAQRGGTGSAVVINTNQNVTQVLQAALNQIRTTAVACEYRLPPATMGPIDFGKVNVQFTPGSGVPKTIGYVGSKANCDPVRGGWYYDVDPASGKPPTSILTCDATCAEFRGDGAARVDIVLGCATIIIT